ncbi:hypothetical protein OG897_29460 [Streptomyces sp. NBC_00237]|uniref:hypothetical protein n=1 Tax=Streptomyces sp. NBC_00237 TaxID=2975687 RepID=UPI00225AAF0B|nr:hypothetical protein [Streptomyces sp. NBC_00237]MCX5205575.1 hypothetical protein [Streptomyces sp. NBC_00237]
MPDFHRILTKLGYRKAPRPASAAAVRQNPEPVEEVAPVFGTVRNGGLGHHAQRTWTRLRADGQQGATVEELCETVGYQARTIVKHLEGLSRYGLVEQRDGDAWHATAKSPWAAAQEHGIPGPRTEGRDRVSR